GKLGSELRPAIEKTNRSIPLSGTAIPQLPTTYGVYTVTGGKLVELEALPGQVSDQRVLTSTKPISTIISEGPFPFVVYRPDVPSGVAEYVDIRVFASSRPTVAAQRNTADVFETWTIRNVAYRFRVVPMTDHQDMLLMIADDPIVTIAPGRYALVIKGQA